MAIDRASRDFAVIKSNGTFNGSITSSISGATISYGDGTTEEGPTLNHNFTGKPPYILNIKESDEDTITGIAISGNNISSVNINRLPNITDVDISYNSIKAKDISNMLSTLDDNGLTDGTIKSTGNPKDTPLPAETGTNWRNLINKQWNLQDVTWSPKELSLNAWYDASDASTVTVKYNGLFNIIDATINSGINPATGQAWKLGDKYRLAFTTSAEITAVDDNIETYNDFVQAAAESAGMGSVTWKAFISTPTVDAKDNTSTNTGDLDTAVFRTNTTNIIAHNLNELFYYPTNGGVRNRIDRDEFGNNLVATGGLWSQYIGVWTGTDKNGETVVGKEAGNSVVTNGISKAENRYQWQRSATSSTEMGRLVAISEPIEIGGILDRVTQWDDKSGNGNHGVQTNASYQPYYAYSDSMFGNFPSVNTDGDNGVYVTTPSFGAKRIYVILYHDDGLSTQWDAHDSPLYNGTGSSNYRITGVTGGNSYWHTAGAFNDDGTYRDGSTTSNLLNAVPMPSTLWKFEASALRTQTWRILCGNNTGWANWLGGMGEIIFTDGTEDLETQQKIEGYLAHKWGISNNLPSDHPYKNVIP
jgi:hypothetical protein